MEDNKHQVSRILLVTEEELQRIILDIHDGSVQNIFAALSKVQAIQLRYQAGNTECQPDDLLELAKISDLLSSALQEIHTILGTMRPPSFLKKSLREIIHGVVLTHETYTSCEVDFCYEEQDVEVDLATKIALYRICQEALNNAFQHSGSKEQSVHLDVGAKEIKLTISDKGSGFVPPPLDGPEATEKEEHIGLRGMRDRIHLVGGTIELHSAPQQGTNIIVKVPLDA